MTKTEARIYLGRLATLHAAVVLFAFGMLLATVGWRLVGGPLMALGFVAGLVAFNTAWIGAVRRRGDKPWFGPESVMEEANESMGWAGVDSAVATLGLPLLWVRRTLRWSVGLAVILFPLVVIAGVAT